MTDKAWPRVIGGLKAIFCEYRGRSYVEVRVGNEYRVLTRWEWANLPLYYR
jgi:hypothetical protein